MGPIPAITLAYTTSTCSVVPSSKRNVSISGATFEAEGATEIIGSAGREAWMTVVFVGDLGGDDTVVVVTVAVG